MNRHERYLRELVTIAEDLDYESNARVVAAVVIKNKIIGIGRNSAKTDPMAARYGKNKDAISLHAEIAAIKNTIRRFKGDIKPLERATVYVARVRYNKEKDVVLGLAKPCKGCHLALTEIFNVKDVYYTLNCAKSNQFYYAKLDS